MFPPKKLIGLELIGLFVMLLCAGSTWGSEAVGHDLDLALELVLRDESGIRFDVTQNELPVVFPLIGKSSSGVVGHSPTLAYSDFSFSFWENQLMPIDWKILPIIPNLSDTSREILEDGLSRGNNPRAFSVIGDCQSFPAVFMGIFDNPAAYELQSDQGYLEGAIAHFSGSFTRESAAVSNGFSVASVLSPLWASQVECLDAESPLECELRLQNPILVFINLGTNWQPIGDLSRQEYLRQIVEFSIDRGILPILSTKGDNNEGNQWINEETAHIALEYDIPLWNFWGSIQYLPQHGIDQDRDGDYLSLAAWNRRSYSGLRMLYQVYKALMELQAVAH